MYLKKFIRALSEKEIRVLFSFLMYGLYFCFLCFVVVLYIVLFVLFLYYGKVFANTNGEENAFLIFIFVTIQFAVTIFIKNVLIGVSHFLEYRFLILDGAVDVIRGESASRKIM